MLLLFLLLVVLVVVATHRIWEVSRPGDAGASDSTGSDGASLNGIFGNSDHRHGRRRAMRLGLVSALGVTAVVVGGAAGGIWGLAAATMGVAAGLWWALGSEPRAGGLTDRERRAFEEIAAMFGDGQGHTGRV